MTPRRGGRTDETASPWSQAVLDEAASLGGRAARRAWLARRSHLATNAALRDLESIVVELTQRDPPRALALAEIGVLLARDVDDDARFRIEEVRARALFRCARYREADGVLHDLALERAARGEKHEAALLQVTRLGPLTNLGELHEALATARLARRWLDPRAGALVRAKLDANTAIVLHRMGRVRESLAFNARARGPLARRGLVRDVAIVDLNRAQAHSELGDGRRADALLASARRIFESLGQTVLVASVDYNVACDDVARGRYDRAWRGLLDVRDRFEALGDPDAVALADLDLAEIAWRLGSPVVAREHAHRAREGFERIGARLDVARARCFEALALARTGAVPKAKSALAAAAEVFAEEGHSQRAALARLDLASLLVADDPARAASLARSIAAVLRREGLHGATLRARLVEGLALARRRAPRAARELEHVARLAGRRAPDVAWQAESALASIRLASGDLASARKHGDRAVDVLDRMRNVLRRLEPARWVLRDGSPAYEQAIAAWLTGSPGPRERERAFLHAERARSRALADALALDPAQKHEPLVLQRRLDVDGALVARGRRAAPAPRGSFGGWSSLTGSQEPSEAARSRALRGALGPSERLVELQCVGDALWAFVVTRDGVEATTLGSCAPEVADLLMRLEFQLGKLAFGTEVLERFLPDLRARVDRLLDDLGRIVLRPIEASLRGGRVIIVPTRELHGAPFAALRLQGKYLVESVTTSLAPSCLVLALLRARRRRGRGALVVGVGSAELPQVDREARDVAALLPGSRVLLGEEASRSRFIAGVSGRAIVHVATHGAFRADRPTLSSLRLADGPLTLEDVDRLPLCADLVTLTACESGRSSVGMGDDLTGLAVAFLRSGARRVLMSPFSLDDAHSRRVMRALYRRVRSLRRGATVADALRHATLESARSARHPGSWSSFALMGVP